METSEIRFSEGSSVEVPSCEGSPNGLSLSMEPLAGVQMAAGSGTPLSSSDPGGVALRLQLQSDEEITTVEEPGEDPGPQAAGSGGRPLGKRRGLKMTIPQVWRRGTPAESPKGTNENNLTPKLNLPAVLCRTEAGRPAQTPKSMLHPLPGAFPNRRTLMFFDWDDTLCPTSWIRRILKDHMSDQWDWAMGADSGKSSPVVDWQDQIPAWFGQPLPDLPHIRDQIGQLQSAVIQVISVAQTLGVVCIVTNAVDGWVDKTMQKWLPELKQYILGHGARPPITVLYGQRQYERPPPDSLAASLAWVDGLGELTWWKQSAMHHALVRVDDLYRLGRASESPRRVPSAAAGGATDPSAEASAPSEPLAEPSQASTAARARFPSVQWQADRGAKGLLSVVSIGDNEAEMQAVELAALAHAARGSTPAAGADGRRRPLSAPALGRPQGAGHPWIKNLKLWECPNADQLIEQLRLLAMCLPQVVAAREHMRLEPEQLRTLLAAPEDSETRLHRLLRTQTV